jgi:dipeptidyl aminopeptidase/acylaminoacyl peptidase
LREDSVKDIGGLLDWIAKQPELDASRVAVTGGSYGGFMVLSTLTHFGDRIKAGIDVVGICNFNTFLANTSPYRVDLRRAEYGDERDPKMKAVFDRISPANRADRIVSALLVAHGRNDPVIKPQDMAMSQDLNGVIQDLSGVIQDFSGGNKTVASGDTISVTYTLSLT